MAELANRLIPRCKLKFKYPLRIGYESVGKVEIYDTEHKVFKAEVQINAVKTEFKGERNSQRIDTDIPLKNPCLDLPFSLPIFDIGYNYPDLYKDPLEGNYDVNITDDIVIVKIKGRQEEYEYLSAEKIGSENGTYMLIPYDVTGGEPIVQQAPKMTQDEIRKLLEGYAGKIYQPECFVLYFFAVSSTGKIFFPKTVPTSKLSLDMWSSIKYYACVSFGNMTSVSVPLHYLQQCESK